MWKLRGSHLQKDVSCGTCNAELPQESGGAEPKRTTPSTQHRTSTGSTPGLTRTCRWSVFLKKSLSLHREAKATVEPSPTEVTSRLQLPRSKLRVMTSALLVTRQYRPGLDDCGCRSPTCLPGPALSCMLALVPARAARTAPRMGLLAGVMAIVKLRLPSLEMFGTTFSRGLPESPKSSKAPEEACWSFSKETANQASLCGRMRAGHSTGRLPAGTGLGKLWVGVSIEGSGVIRGEDWQFPARSSTLETETCGKKNSSLSFKAVPGEPHLTGFPPPPPDPS
mmetsp:Transcript_9479/g.21034  ORF Transcript_9479/g.21034 Transcript_9479/m.21034 type:complete len:281 (-) Transcript_9479:661-1503(-)